MRKELPRREGEVAIMRLEDLYVALGGVLEYAGTNTYMEDPTWVEGSTYCVYAIRRRCDCKAPSWVSTKEALYEVGVSWFRKLPMPNTVESYWKEGNYEVFGGPLVQVTRTGGLYGFEWVVPNDSVIDPNDSLSAAYATAKSYDEEYPRDYWPYDTSDAYVAVVRSKCKGRVVA